MATIRAVILKQQQKDDNTFNVKIRVTHNRTSAYISTLHYVNKNQIDSKYKIKETDPINNIIGLEVIRYRQILSALSYSINNYSAKQIVDIIQKEANTKNEQYNFLQFMQAHYELMKVERRGTGWESYRAAYNHLFSFSKGHLDFRSLTSSVLVQFEKYLTKQGVGGRGISLYMNCIRATFNEGRKIYNDEDLGIIKIPNYPFSRYSIPKTPEPQIKAAGIEVVKLIHDYKPKDTTEQLAKDMFLLSFYLMGMNAKDIFSCDSQITKGRLTYSRSKTKDQRSDNATISIKIADEVNSIVKQYSDIDKLFTFNIYNRFSNIKNFNIALSSGFIAIRKSLKEGMKESEYNTLNLDNLTMYSARHSWATIASHNCDIIDSHIAKCLNHASVDFRTTNKYIKRDWSLIDKCNRQVIDFVNEYMKPKDQADKVVE